MEIPARIFRLLSLYIQQDKNTETIRKYDIQKTNDGREQVDINEETGYNLYIIHMETCVKQQKHENPEVCHGV